MLWFENKNKTASLSTRIRLARNLKNVPFPSRLKPSELKNISSSIAKKIKACDFGMKMRMVDMDSLGEVEAYAMVERHIISPKFAANREGRMLLLSEDESVSIMLCEEDHIRIQVIKSGLCLKEAYTLAEKIEDTISKVLDFAYSDSLGFLTECPTNLGTGMRASVMLHLPATESTGELKNLAAAASKIGLTFRGFYGEGSDAKASVYQLSNQISLGVSEENALSNLENIAKQIIEREEKALEKYNKEALEDKVYRSLGILKFARRLDTKEMMTHLSALMLGERAGIIDLKDKVPLIVFITLQPSMIKRVAGEKEPHERDIYRAEAMRKYFETIG